MSNSKHDERVLAKASVLQNLLMTSILGDDCQGQAIPAEKQEELKRRAWTPSTKKRVLSKNQQMLGELDRALACHVAKSMSKKLYSVGRQKNKTKKLVDENEHKGKPSMASKRSKKNQADRSSISSKSASFLPSINNTSHTSSLAQNTTRPGASGANAGKMCSSAPSTSVASVSSTPTNRFAGLKACKSGSTLYATMPIPRFGTSLAPGAMLSNVAKHQPSWDSASTCIMEDKKSKMGLSVSINQCSNEKFHFNRKLDGYQVPEIDSWANRPF